MNQIINDAFYDSKTGYVSASKLYIKIKVDYPRITQYDVKQFIDKQYTSQLNRAIRLPKMFNSIFSPSVRNNYQMDIIVYDRYAYNGYKYILVVIDVYSRYVSARAMTNRSL